MIQRLEKAGLGFYVQSAKTIHKLGMLVIGCNVISSHIIITNSLAHAKYSSS